MCVVLVDSGCCSRRRSARRRRRPHRCRCGHFNVVVVVRELTN